MATEQTLDTINNTNLKVIAENPSWTLAQKQANDISHAKRTDQLAELALQNAISHQNRINTLSESYVGGMLEKSVSIDPAEAVSSAKMFKGESDSAILSLLTQLNGGQIGAKIAQSTAPETGVPIVPLMAQLNALNSQNYNNNTTNASLAATMGAISTILSKIAYNNPPVPA